MNAEFQNYTEKQENAKESEVEESEEKTSNSSDGYLESSHWRSLPDVCLQHVFKFLQDRDRSRAALVCHRWRNAMRCPSLWRSRCFHFRGRLNRSWYDSAIAYVSSLGVHLERLEIHVCPPRRQLLALRLERTISELFAELTRVEAQLRSFSLTGLELDRSSWTMKLRNSLLNSLMAFLRRGSSKLTSVSLAGMRNTMDQGLEVLSTLLHSESGFFSRCSISHLNLEGFFASYLQVHINTNMAGVMHNLQDLTDLKLSYSCLSDQLLMALHTKRQALSLNSQRNRKTLQTLSLHCTLHEPHWQLVSGGSWASLASNCPDLKVKLTVDQAIFTDQLARILLPEIPLTEFHMTSAYYTNPDWSAMPLLSELLPQYIHSLQHLSLDMGNYDEPLDAELLELVKVCERLQQLVVWAFMEIITVKRLLHIRLSHRTSLNQITVKIYSVDDVNEEQCDQLEEIKSCYPNLPPELDFFATVSPYV